MKLSIGGYIRNEIVALQKRMLQYKLKYQVVVTKSWNDLLNDSEKYEF